jgi:predicted TPR repeat methyltransferase
MFNPQAYWNNSLSKEYSLEGVGDFTLGKYNIYLYRLRKVVFRNLINKFILNVKDKRVADVGAGTGFYINLWDRVSAGKITGFDISEYAVERLTERFRGSKFSFKFLDISANIQIPEKFDVVSAFDVFYHIVDDGKYISALKNVHGMLDQNGIFIFSDNLIKGEKEFRIKHQVCRSKEFVLKNLKNTGFEIVAIKPMFVLMNKSFYPRIYLLNIYSLMRVKLQERVVFWRTA